MTRNSIDLLFADGEYTFSLPAPRIDELQRKTGVGIGALFARLLKGAKELRLPGAEQIGGLLSFDPMEAEFYAVDIVETIRQGLIGGDRGIVDGVEVKITPALVERLIQNYVLDRPLYNSWSTAAAIMGACILGYDPPKKGLPAGEAGDPPRKPAKSKKAGSTTASS